jgi:predicted TIM-barrel fold metal-dependent hydrolase
MTTRRPARVHDAHRHLGVLPAHPFYGGPPVNPDTAARATTDELLADLDREGVERALVLPNYGVPDPSTSFALNDVVIEAAQRDDRILAGLWTSPRPQDAAATEKALALAGERGVAALKLSFLLGGRAGDEACRPQLDAIFGLLVDRYADDVPLHLVHLGGGMSGHIKLIGHRFFDWIAAGKRVYTDTSWAIGFAPRWLAAEIERRGIGADRVLFASDEPWGDFAGEHARLWAAAGDGELAEHVFSRNFEALHGLG